MAMNRHSAAVLLCHLLSAVLTRNFHLIAQFWLKLYVVNCWRRGSVVRASVSDWRTFPDMCLIFGWRVTTSCVRRPLWVNQPGQLSLLPSVGWGMSSISVARWKRLLAAVSPSSKYLYERKADVVYLQVTLWSTSEHLVVELYWQ